MRSGTVLVIVTSGQYKPAEEAGGLAPLGRCALLVVNDRSRVPPLARLPSLADPRRGFAAYVSAVPGPHRPCLPRLLDNRLSVGLLNRSQVQVRGPVGESVPYRLVQVGQIYQPGGAKHCPQHSGVDDDKAANYQPQLPAYARGIGGSYVELALHIELSWGLPTVDHEPTPGAESAEHFRISQQRVVQDNHHVRFLNLRHDHDGAARRSGLIHLPERLFFRHRMTELT